MRKYSLAMIMLLLALFLLITKATTAAVSRQITPQELIAPVQMGVDPAGNPLYSSFGQWFQAKTGQGSVSEEWFGAYNFLAANNKLYISFGKGRPAEFCGAAFSVFDGNTLDFIFEPDEDGLHDTDISQDTIFIAGTDPCNGDGWQGGNMYSYAFPGPAQKLRWLPNGDYTLPNVVHVWGIWVNPTNGEIYISSSGHTGDFQTDASRVHLSTDNGQTWQLLATINDFHTDSNRAMDIIGFNGRLYLVSRTEESPIDGTNVLLQSSDGGITWSIVPNVVPDHQARLVIHRQQLVILGHDLQSIYTIDIHDAIRHIPFPGFEIAGYYEPTWQRNYIGSTVMVSGHNRLFLITNDGRVIMTTKFNRWEVISDSDLEYITIGYWPQQKKIVLAERGVDGKLWSLNLQGRVSELSSESDASDQ